MRGPFLPTYATHPPSPTNRSPLYPERSRNSTAFPNSICLRVDPGIVHHFCVPKLGLLVFSPLLLSAPLHSLPPLGAIPVLCLQHRGRRVALGNQGQPGICTSYWCGICQAQSSRELGRQGKCAAKVFSHSEILSSLFLERPVHGRDADNWRRGSFNTGWKGL